MLKSEKKLHRNFIKLLETLTGIGKFQEKLHLCYIKHFTCLVKFQVLMVACMKMTAFWDFALCSLVDDCPDDGGSKHL
jgi:hypothetical protein